jgi:hypothetical protein
MRLSMDSRQYNAAFCTFVEVEGRDVKVSVDFHGEFGSLESETTVSLGGPDGRLWYTLKDLQGLVEEMRAIEQEVGGVG